jgi:hypothetical protein
MGFAIGGDLIVGGGGEALQRFMSAALDPDREGLELVETINLRPRDPPGRRFVHVFDFGDDDPPVSRWLIDLVEPYPSLNFALVWTEVDRVFSGQHRWGPGDTTLSYELGGEAQDRFDALGGWAASLRDARDWAALEPAGNSSTASPVLRILRTLVSEGLLRERSTRQPWPDQ